MQVLVVKIKNNEQIAISLSEYKDQLELIKYAIEFPQKNESPDTYWVSVD